MEAKMDIKRKSAAEPALAPLLPEVEQHYRIPYLASRLGLSPEKIRRMSIADPDVWKVEEKDGKKATYLIPKHVFDKWSRRYRGGVAA